MNETLEAIKTYFKGVKPSGVKLAGRKKETSCF